MLRKHFIHLRGLNRIHVKANGHWTLGLEFKSSDLGGIQEEISGHVTYMVFTN